MARAYLPSISPFHPLTILVSFFWVGKMPFAPGTWGSLPAFPIAFLVFFHYGKDAYWILPTIIASLLIIGSFVIQMYTDITRRPDPKEVVIDEVVGQLITIFAAAPVMGAMPDHGGKEGYILLAACFVLFRFFDIVKIWPASFFDKKVKNGFGVMMDDVMAGVQAAIVLHILVYFFTSYRVLGL